MRNTRRRKGDGGLGDFQELGFSRGLHRALCSDLQPVRKPSEQAAGRSEGRVHRADEFHITSAERQLQVERSSRRRSSPWAWTLLDALGHELQAQPIKVEKLPDAYELEFFRPKTPFSKTYNVRFESPPSSDFVGHQIRFDYPQYRAAAWAHRADLAERRRVCTRSARGSARGSARTIARIAPSRTSFSIGFST